MNANNVNVIALFRTLAALGGGLLITVKGNLMEVSTQEGALMQIQCDGEEQVAWFVENAKAEEIVVKAWVYGAWRTM
jgi:hypothetical protein